MLYQENQPVKISISLSFYCQTLILRSYITKSTGKYNISIFDNNDAFAVTPLVLRGGREDVCKAGRDRAG